MPRKHNCIQREPTRLGDHHRKPREPHASRLFRLENTQREYGIMRDGGIASPRKLDIPIPPQKGRQRFQRIAAHRIGAVEKSETTSPFRHGVQTHGRTFLEGARHRAVTHVLLLPAPQGEGERRQKRQREYRPKEMSQPLTGHPIPSGTARSHVPSSCR